MKRIFKSLISICSIAVLLTGCYKDEIAELHNQIDEINIKSVEEQVAGLKATIASLSSIQGNTTTLVQELQNAKTTIEQNIANIEKNFNLSDAAWKDSVSVLQNKLAKINSTLSVLDANKLTERVKEIEALVETLKTEKITERIAALEVADLAFVTLDSLKSFNYYLNLEIQGIKNDINTFNEVINNLDEKIIEQIENCKDEIVSWISDSDEIKALFNQYYSKSEMNAILDEIYTTDTTQNNTLNYLQEQIDGVGEQIATAINTALETADVDSKLDTTKFNSVIAEIKNVLNELTSITNIVTSVVYLPEYSDGMATLKRSTDGSRINEVVLQFKVNTNGAFDASKYSYFGDLRSAQTRSAVTGTKINPLKTPTFDKEKSILTVTFRGSDFDTATKGATIALVIADNADIAKAKTVTSEFVPMYIDELSLLSVSMDATTLYFALSNANPITFKVTSNFSDVTAIVEKSDDWISTSQVGDNFTISVSNTGTARTGSVTIKASTGNEVYTYAIVQDSNFTLTDSKNNTTASVIYFDSNSHTEEFTLGGTAFQGGEVRVSVTRGGYWLDAYWDGKKIVVKVDQNRYWGWNIWGSRTGSFTITANGRTQEFTVSQEGQWRTPWY